MKKLFISNLYVIFLFSCTKDEKIHTEKLMPKRMVQVCQKNDHDTLDNVQYEYLNGNLINEKHYSGYKTLEINYHYNSKNNKVLETIIYPFKKTEIQYIYNAIDQLINTINKYNTLDSSGQTTATETISTTHEYQNNLLVKSHSSQGTFSTYEYCNGKISKTITHTANGQKHHVYSYKYYHDRILEEKKETIGGTMIYLHKYFYNKNMQLLKIKENENTIEEYLYMNNKLVEKRDFYFGGDAAHNPCNGNFVTKFEY